MCVPDSNAEALIPNVIILADGEIGREVDLDEVMRVERSELINTLIRKDEKSLWYEYAARRLSCSSQEESSHYKADQPAPLSWISQALKTVRNKYLLCISHTVYGVSL